MLDETGADKNEEGRKPGPGRRRLSGHEDAAALTEATRADIIAAATREFVRNGFEGASINSIAAATQTSKRMLYYHFGSKRALYRAVLEAAYARVGRKEPPADAPALPPMAALRQYAEEAYENFRTNEDFVRLVMAENMNDGGIIRESEFVRQRSSANFASLEAIWRQGVAAGVMRADIRILDLYLAIVAICFHAVSNRISTSISLGIDLASEAEIGFRRKLVGDIACRYVESCG